MAIFKCKMCGGDLEIQEGLTICECEYCGTKQTIPALDNEKKLNLFNRANRLRLNSEFDKAASIYENIIAEFPEEAEGYWGLVLCNYGIEYVDDPATAKKIPTCHRAAFESVTKDENYELALEYADVISQKVYRDEAREIDRIMSEILSISKNEEPYDIFICYKETDTSGGRTIDSVIAQDVYDALTDKGYRVFFSRISLEDKIGKQYEPYIFAALNSAKVMLAFGTKYEYFHAVWVKNEWSRFLKLMAKDKTKSLVPCYKDLDPYDMPDEFKALQAQDMGKVGAIQDLVRGIEKLIGKETTVVSTVSVTADGSALTTRGYIYLEDGDYVKAESYFDRALDENPMDSKAYIGKVLASLRLTSLDGLRDTIVDLTTFKDFDRALRFATGQEKIKLEEIKEKAEKKNVCMKLVVALNKIKAQEVAFERKQKEAEVEAERKRIEAERKRIEAEEEKEQKRLKEENKAKLGAKRETLKKLQTIVCSGYANTVGLKSDGTVIATKYTGSSNLYDGQCDVSNWKDIVAISAGDDHTVGLKSDGTVIATKYTGYSNLYDGQCDVSNWKDIVAISAGCHHTVGLKSDGTVVAVGSNEYRQCEVENWRDDKWSDIVAISAGCCHTVGLRSDGTVVVVGRGIFRTRWTDIVTISAGYHHTVGLRSDGTVVAVHSDFYGKHSECDVSEWTDIVAISAGGYHTVGLKSDGTVVAVGDNIHGRCDVSEWKDIVAISAGFEHTVGLKSDGTVVAVGSNICGQCDVGSWKLFNSIDTIEEERAIAKQRNIQMLQYRSQGLCQHCGGELKGFLVKKCIKCGKLKDY